jgi:hypothetical protein
MEDLMMMRITIIMILRMIMSLSTCIIMKKNTMMTEVLMGIINDKILLTKKTKVVPCSLVMLMVEVMKMRQQCGTSNNG